MGRLDSSDPRPTFTPERGGDWVHDTFRTKRDTVDWARSTEDVMLRSLYVRQALRFAAESVRECGLLLLTGS